MRTWKAVVASLGNYRRLQCLHTGEKVLAGYKGLGNVENVETCLIKFTIIAASCRQLVEQWIRSLQNSLTRLIPESRIFAFTALRGPSCEVVVLPVGLVFHKVFSGFEWCGCIEKPIKSKEIAHPITI
jgi:hypothetical protein